MNNAKSVNPCFKHKAYGFARFDTTVAHALKPYGARRRMVCALATAFLVFGFAYYIYNTAQRKGWFKIKAPFFTFTDRATGLKVGDPVNMMGLMSAGLRK